MSMFTSSRANVAIYQFLSQSCQWVPSVDPQVICATYTYNTRPRFKVLDNNNDNKKKNETDQELLMLQAGVSKIRGDEPREAI